jgi:hypothetical protein
VTLRAALLAGDEMDRAVAWTREEIDHATRIAAAFALPHVAEVIRGREAFLSTIPSILVAQCVQQDVVELSSVHEVTP